MKQPTPSVNPRFHLRETIIIALLAALTVSLKEAMAMLPNIEPVTLLFILITCHFGWKAMGAVGIFIVAETLFYGLSLWTFQYIYLWPLLVVIVMLLRRWSHPVLWTVVGGLYGLLFGTLSAIPYLFTRGPGGALAWIINGISFDVTHAIANTVIVGLLFWPLSRLLTKLLKAVK